MAKDKTYISDIPELIAEWDYEKNTGISTDSVTSGCGQKVWWICPNGHSYSARIDHRCSMHSGCPYCAGKKPLRGETDLASVYPEIAAEWDRKNNPDPPEEYLPYSNIRKSWVCPICEKSYTRKIVERTLGKMGCPYCTKPGERSTSQQEQSFVFYLSQVTCVVNRKKIEGYEVDVYLPELRTGIEYHGEYYHLDRTEKDQAKAEHLAKLGIRLITIKSDRTRSVAHDTVVMQTSSLKTNPSDTELEWAISETFGLLSFPLPDINLKRDRSKIYALYIGSIKKNSLAEQHPKIASEWNYSLNKGLKPEMFAAASNKIVWWTCSKCKNDYEMKIANRTSNSQGCPFCAGKKVKAGYNDLATTHPQIAAEWDHEKNDKSPQDYSYGSDIKVWWICKKCGYSWIAAISSRTAGKGCPACAGKIVISGVNDLATICPDALKIWDYDRNNVMPGDVLAHSNKKAHWKCDHCGHEWEAVISSVVSGCRCPLCARKNRPIGLKNTLLLKRGSFAEQHPELLDEWDYERNEKQPEEYLSGSDQKVQWVCKTCGYHWSMSIYCRTKQGQGCPKCGREKSDASRHSNILARRGTLADQCPDLLSEWDFEKNEKGPECYTKGSKESVWWKCSKGHSWSAKIYARTGSKKSGCPICANKKLLRGFNDLLTLYPQIASEWCNERNTPLTPSDVIPGTHQKVWWRCKDCGFEWHAEIRTRIRGRGCPECARRKMGNTFRSNMITNGTQALQNAFPQLALEWDFEKNHPYTPSDFTSFSSKRVFWKCPTCGNSWRTSISNRTSQHSGCPVCTHNQILAGYNDLATLNPELAREWHPTKNMPLTVQTVGARSGQNVWWVCKYGHEYRCRISDRVRGVGCSECSKRFRYSLREKAIVYYLEKSRIDVRCNYHTAWLARSEIDIFLPDKSIGIEYDGQRYHQKTERDIRKDELCRNNQITLIRIREPNCPDIIRDDPTFILPDLSNSALTEAIHNVLSYLGVLNADVDVDRDIQTISAYYRNSATSGNLCQMYPELAKEFLSSRNKNLLPENIPATYSKEKYYWKCSVCGYEWIASLGERINGTGCPACAGKVIISGRNDLATTHPQLALEWHPTKNGNVTPQNVSKGSDFHAWWRCSVCGYEWQVRIKNRVHGSGCNRCAANNRSASLRKKVYQYSLSGELIQEYDSVAAAAEATGVSKSAIKNACNPNAKLQTAGGYRWSYTKK